MLTAPEELRARAVSAGAGGGGKMSLAEARREVRRDDARKRRFMRRQFHAESDDPSGYDAIFNLRALDAGLAADLILSSFRRIAAGERRTAGAGV